MLICPDFVAVLLSCLQSNSACPMNTRLASMACCNCLSLWFRACCHAGSECLHRPKPHQNTHVAALYIKTETQISSDMTCKCLLCPSTPQHAAATTGESFSDENTNPNLRSWSVGSGTPSHPWTSPLLSNPLNQLRSGMQIVLKAMSCTE